MIKYSLKIDEEINLPDWLVEQLYKIEKASGRELTDKEALVALLYCSGYGDVDKEEIQRDSIYEVDENYECYFKKKTVK